MRQGDAIAPLEIAIRRCNIETQGTIFDKCSQIMAYVDDVVIMGIRLQYAEVFTSLIKQTNKMGLEKNLKKTKFIILPYLLHAAESFLES